MLLWNTVFCSLAHLMQFVWLCLRGSCPALNYRMYVSYEKVVVGRSVPDDVRLCVPPFDLIRAQQPPRAIALYRPVLTLGNNIVKERGD